MTKTIDTPLQNPSRRRFIVSTAAAGGGLALGLHVPDGTAQSASAADAELNLWVVVKPDNTCVIRIARAEMGQGTVTGLAQLVAEELECDWARVTLDPITPARNLASKRAWGEMGTGGSRGIRTSEDYVRRGGAAARIMLLQAAANQWNVPVGELKVDKGVVTHASGKRSTYGELAAAAAKVPPPDLKAIKLKDPRTWTIAGQPLHRLDTADKLDGRKVYSIDVQLPGMLNAAIKQCPVFGGRLAGYDSSKVVEMRGVKGVVKVDDSTIAVVADTWWRAKKALDAMPIRWDEGENGKVDSASIAKHLESGLNAPNAFKYRNEGDAPAAIAGAARKVEAVYSTPFLAHATMEPMNCTARVAADRAECWVPTQNAEASMAALSEASGIPLNKCEVHRTDLGCGFGRRGGDQDYTRQAATIARHFPGVAVKLIWSREEDMTHDFYRPISQCKLAAGLDANGNLTGMHIRISGQSINARVNPAAIGAGGADRRQLQGLWIEPHDAQLGYTFPNLLVEYAMRNTHVPVGPWRGVNTNQNGIYMECFMDEVAKAAGKDPLEFRRQFMAKYPKHLGVLNAAAEKAGWGTPLAPGRFRGIAQFMGYFSYSAAVAEVSLVNGKVKVHRMVLATNCGHAVNPHQIAAQVEGSVAYGLSAAFYGENTVKNGRMVEGNFHDYPIVRLGEFPQVDTVLVPTFDFWGGVGEPTICVVAPALMNAIHAATGKPVRSLPLKNLKLA